MKLKFKRIISIFILFFIVFTPIISYADDIEEEFTDEEIAQEIKEVVTNLGKKVDTVPTINSRAAIVMDRTTGVVIYEKNLNQVRKMASTTKIMTAIVVIENGNLGDIVTVSKKAGGTGGSTAGLKAGDKISVKDLLYGLMLPSGNDAAVSLAEYIGGSIEGFSELMNAKATELGLTNSHFVTPHGLDSDGHYTTVYELALITDYALKIPLFQEIVKTSNYVMSVNGNPKELRNTNELLGYMDGVYGVKTGFTNGANRCLVTAVKRGNLDLIAIVLGADTKKHRTRDSINIIEYVYKNYELRNIESVLNGKFNEWKNDSQKEIIIDKGVKLYPELILGDVKYKQYPLKKGDIDKLEFEFSNIRYIEAPVENNFVFGKMDVKLDGALLFSVDILNKEEVRKKNIWNYFSEIITNIPSYVSAQELQ